MPGDPASSTAHAHCYGHQRGSAHLWLTRPAHLALQLPHSAAHCRHDGLRLDHLSHQPVRLGWTVTSVQNQGLLYQGKHCTQEKVDVGQGRDQAGLAALED